MAKYEETKDWSFLWGNDHFLYDWKIIDDELHLYLKSKPHTCECPSCGAPSRTIHATYERTLQEVPFRGIPTYLHVRAYKYDCENEKCDVRTFNELLPFAHGYQQRTDNLNNLIMGMSIFMSNEGTSRVLKQLGVKVSNDTIGALWERVEFEEAPDIEAIGIDDIATRKGQKYATAIYDAEDHHLITLIKGRSAADVTEWLKQHPKVKRVARDRASAYASAISEILPEAMQVADRFHLMQNLLGYLEKVFRDDLPKTVFVSENGLVSEEDVVWETEVKEAGSNVDISALHYDNSPPRDENGEEIDFDPHKHCQSQSAKQGAANRKKNSR